MLRVELEPGDPVQAGDTVVARLQPTDPALLDVRTRAELQARVQAAQAAVGRARAEQQRVSADLEFARRDLKRYQELMAAGLASREQLETMQRSVRTLEEALTSADFAIRTAQYELQAARAGLLQAEGRGPAPRAAVELRSPVDGVLLRRLQESETIVQPGQPIVEIGDLRRMEVVSDLLSTDAVKVAPGNRVRLEQWGGAAPLAGRVRRVEPSGFTKISALGVEEQRVNVIVDFDDPIAASKSLGDGYRVEVRIVIWERDAVLKVPTSSLFRVDGRWAVYRVEGERALLRRVTVGQRGGLDAELLSGLEEGDTIVVYPSDDVVDGVKITRRN
jgi:HlyD family secretion protein